MGKLSEYARRFGLKFSHFGSNTNGHDVKAFGDTTGKYFMWDASLNKFILAGDFEQTGNQAVTGTHSASGGYTGNVAGNVAGYALKSEARTATANGTTTGTISAGTTHVVVTCDDANKIIVLPAPVPGLVVTLINGATGYELRTSAPATISINGGAEANAESAIAANMVIVMTCVSATAWIGASYTAAGVVGVVDVAAAA
jgi:hypothetical protein